jgi:hypothetical protein
MLFLKEQSPPFETKNNSGTLLLITNINGEKSLDPPLMTYLN